MSNIIKKHYIKLCYYKEIDYTENKYEIDNKRSWDIFYIREENCYTCKNKFDNKITKMIDVENFIRIWNHDMYNITRNINDNMKIGIYIEDKCFSGYKCDRNSKIPVEAIKIYINLLKDIIDKNNIENIDEDYNIIDN